MHSFYADGDRILGEEAAHLSKVLRLKAGEEIVAIEKGQRTLARLTSVGKEEARFEPLRPLPSGEAACRVTLYQGLCKGEKMEYVVQKCTEMGVHAIVPVAMARSVQRPGSDKYLERLSRIAREAVKQCGRSLPPRIGPALGFDQALSAMAAHEALFMPYELGGAPLQAPLRERDVGLLIGPEGGIAPEEAQAVAALGGRAGTLGSRILRTETAGLVALTLVMHLCGELGGTAP